MSWSSRGRFRLSCPYVVLLLCARKNLSGRVADLWRLSRCDSGRTCGRPVERRTTVRPRPRECGTRNRPPSSPQATRASHGCTAPERHPAPSWIDRHAARDHDLAALVNDRNAWKRGLDLGASCVWARYRPERTKAARSWLASCVLVAGAGLSCVLVDVAPSRIGRRTSSPPRCPTLRPAIGDRGPLRSVHPTRGHIRRSAHSPHAGRRAWQVRRPCRSRFMWNSRSSPTGVIRSISSWSSSNGAPGRNSPSRVPTRETWVSTGTSCIPNANSRTHAAVLRPTPGRLVRYSCATGTGWLASQSRERPASGSSRRTIRLGAHPQAGAHPPAAGRR